jgi:hypothetical protein
MSCRLNIILDLDNTIINSIAYPRVPLVPKGLKLDYKDIGDFITFKRPHLDRFLTFLFENFNVGVYTLGSRDYAEDIVWNFIQHVPNRKVDFILSREDEIINKSLEKYNRFNLTKNLNYIWNDLRVYDYYPCNTFIIDDNPYVKQSNQVNTISIHKFEVLFDNNQFNQECEFDNVLLEVIKELAKLKKEYEGTSCSISKRNTRCTNINKHNKKIPDFIDVKRMGRFFPQDLE